MRINWRRHHCASAFTHDIIDEETQNGSFGELLLYLPFYFLLLVGLPAFGITVVVKWLLAGKYKPAAWPIYHYKVWLSEAVTCTYEALAVPFLLDALRGTCWLPWCMRLLGVKMGKRVWLNTTDITEYDMVHIDDEAMLNEDCGPQTHLFEDKIMKIGSVYIGKRAVVGSKTIVLYNSRIENDAQIDALSLVMKGEELPAATHWTGSPVRSDE
jgi:non-ribosomal peptide synthetase-like protein